MSEEEKQQLLASIRVGIFDMALGDIYKASQGGAKMGAFVLASCFIDYLAGFRYGVPAKRTEYKNFVREYLNYDPDSLYTDMRCGIVHNYTEGGSYTFMYDIPLFHRYKPGGFGKLCINLENFIAEIEGAANTYYGQLEGSDELLALAKARMDANGILRIQDHI